MTGQNRWKKNQARIFLISLILFVFVSPAIGDERVTHEAFIKCFFPLGDEILVKPRQDEIVLFFDGDPDIGQYVHEKLEYYTNELNGVPVRVSGKGVNHIVAMPENVFRYAILNFEILFNHMGKTAEEIISIIGNSVSKGSSNIEIVKYIDDRSNFATMIVHNYKSRAKNLLSIDGVLARILFPRKQSHEVIEDRRCSRILDPNDSIGREIGLLYNRAEFREGISLEEFMRLVE